MNDVILILGGTKEAAQIAEKLTTKNPTARIISSLAGRTKEPKPIFGEVRIGGFGGVQGLINFIAENKVTTLIDATHPFAKNISKNAKEAAKETDVEFQIRRRSPWQKHPNDNWIEVKSLQAARQEIPKDARVLLALGSQHIESFATRTDVHFIIRMVDQPEKPLPFKNYTLEIGRPGDVQHEITLLRHHKTTHILCRNSGGDGAYAKIEAARSLNIPVIIIQNN